MHRFGIGPSFAIGVEEELFAVDAFNLQPTSAGELTDSGRRWPIGAVRPELCDAMVELITPICACAADAAAVLSVLREELLGRGATLIGAGLHPTHEFGNSTAADGARYAELHQMLRGLWTRTPYCGMHIHVGMPDPETAVRAANAMRRWIPVIAALAANSPFWHGQDSGLASARSAVLRSFPRTGIPRAFTSYDEFLHTVECITAAGELADYTTIWWDIRLHPRLGTLEVRVADTQSSVADAAAIAALVHCLAVHEATEPPRSGPSPEELDECAFRAMRDGRAAVLHFDGTLQPLDRIVRGALERIAPIAERLRCADELAGIERIVREGNGADRQRAAFARGGMTELLGHLRDETATPAGAEPRQPAEAAVAA
jgi:glutamate---cysteine ligase / carboxylate-amine ligase